MDRLAAMEAFVRVVEAGSFSRAAHDLNLSQPAVSRMVLQTEKRLGVRLLVRSTRGLSPTEAGQNYYERAQRAIAEADEAERAARGLSAVVAGHLRVSAGVTFARLYIVPRLREFLAMHRHVSMDVLMDDGPVDLVKEGLNVALRIGSPDAPPASAQRLASSPRYVLGTPAYFERFGVPGTPAELALHKSVIYTRPTGGDTWLFRQGTTEVPINLRAALRVDAAEGVRSAVLAGMGLSISSLWMFGPELASGVVRRVLGDWTLPAVDLWAVYPQGCPPDVKARAFIAFLVETLHRNQALDRSPDGSAALTRD